MRNTWPCAPPASPSAPATDSYAGQSRSWHPPAPGSAHKSARSGRAPPSTCHYRGREKGASSGTIRLRLPQRGGGSSMRSEMRGADQWLRQHFNKQQHHHPPPPPLAAEEKAFQSRWPSPTVRAVCGRRCSNLCSPALSQQHSRSVWGIFGQEVKWGGNCFLFFFS